MTEYNIRLNPNCASVVHTGLKFKSGDKGISFVITVDELDTTGTTAKIVFLRANGTSVESDIAGTDGVYTYKTLGNEFAVPGKTVADVKFYTSGNRESTASFVFEVCGDTMNGLGAGTGGYSDRLEQLVAEAEEAEDNLATMEAEMAAVLQRFKEQYGEVGALNPRGNWNSDVTYQIRDLVYYNSISWICLASNTGITPSDANSGYWMRSTDLESILNGTTPVGNANKLGGKSASGYVGASTLANGTDFNTVTTCGVYRINSGHPNQPSNIYDYGQLLVLNGNQADTIVQICCSTAREDISVRQKYGNDREWNQWVRLANHNDLANYLPLDGSVPMSGDITVNKGADTSRFTAQNNKGKVALIISSDGSFGIWDYTKSDYLIGKRVDGTVISDGNIVLHTGNKPSGTYTGNGSATERVIDTKGIGSTLRIVGNSCMGYVSSNGSIFTNTSGNVISEKNVKFEYGVLTIKTAEAHVNGNGATFWYQVL